MEKMEKYEKKSIEILNIAETLLEKKSYQERLREEGIWAFDSIFNRQAVVEVDPRTGKISTHTTTPGEYIIYASDNIEIASIYLADLSESMEQIMEPCRGASIEKIIQEMPELKDELLKKIKFYGLDPNVVSIVSWDIMRSLGVSPEKFCEIAGESYDELLYDYEEYYTDVDETVHEGIGDWRAAIERFWKKEMKNEEENKKN